MPVLLPTPPRRRVLLLEDDHALAASMCRMLEVYGHSVTRFATVAAARAAIPPIGFDVLLCDHDLPDGTGLDFLADVQRASGDLTAWTTILCSGQDRRRELTESGLAVDHLLLKGAAAAREILDVLAAA